MYELLPRVSACSDDLPFNEDPSPNQPFQSQFLHEAIFAGGSFWEVEAAYGNINGVVKTSTGYFGGTLRKPSYKQVCEGGTGHTEAVKVVYDIRRISFTSLCDLFWENHDPTVKEFLVKFWVKYTPKISDILLTRGGEKTSTRVKDKEADEDEQENSHKDFASGK
ncbi:hypothetical protein Cgig2_029871 [Carnegiea gigantea]|uniref:peptide-methionine (S)-S-oxide reductase n=1 Tax=Carnegiea gigantea TaxID=171969 RepID=A0A9Q1K4E7_9CARY|nr:hypothetical protein Cgig2_029871 [Carnegiea gigantea]